MQGDKMRWRGGDTRRIRIPCHGKKIAIGSLMFWSPALGAVKPCDGSWGVDDEDSFKKYFVDNFVGVALSHILDDAKSEEDHRSDIYVGTAGRYLLPCKPAKYKVGDCVTVCMSCVRNRGLVHIVNAVEKTSIFFSIGEVVKETGARAKEVLVAIDPQIMQFVQAVHWA